LQFLPKKSRLGSGVLSQTDKRRERRERRNGRERYEHGLFYYAAKTKVGGFPNGGLGIGK